MSRGLRSQATRPQILLPETRLFKSKATLHGEGVSQDTREFQEAGKVKTVIAEGPEETVKNIYVYANGFKEPTRNRNFTASWGTEWGQNDTEDYDSF